MTLNLPLLYFVCTEEYFQTSPNNNKSPNLWHVTSILVCCIFGQIPHQYFFDINCFKLLLSCRKSHSHFIYLWVISLTYLSRSLVTLKLGQVNCGRCNLHRGAIQLCRPLDWLWFCTRNKRHCPLQDYLGSDWSQRTILPPVRLWFWKKNVSMYQNVMYWKYPWL